MVDWRTDITEQNREKDQTMSSTESDNADEHSKVKDMKELRVWKAKDDNTTDFRQGDTAEDLQREAWEHGQVHFILRHLRNCPCRQGLFRPVPDVSL